MMRRFLLIASLCCQTALAQPPQGERQTKAYQYYNDGKEAFKANRFEEALKLFEQANVLDPSPVLVYNIARTYEEMGRAEDACRYYGLYLDLEPQAPDKNDVERRIRVMTAIQQRNEQDAERIQLKPWAITTSVVGGAALLTGAAFGIAMHHFESEQRDSTNPESKGDYADKAKHAATVANVGWIAGGILLGTGATLFALDYFNRKEDATKLTLTPTGLFLQGRF